MSRQGAVRMVLIGLTLVAAGAAATATSLLPSVPSEVMELYLPEEQEACRTGYAMYSALPTASLSSLRSDGKMPIAMAEVPEARRAVLAAWFNSARWGCEPAAEKLGAAEVARSTLLLTQKEGVVELALQSPRKKLWRKVAIACTRGKVGWVRDGLPLSPAWGQQYTEKLSDPRDRWPGGLLPPAPDGRFTFACYQRRLAHEGYMRNGALCAGHHAARAWYELRDLYGIYASLPSAALRRIRGGRPVRLELARLSARDREALTRVLDLEREGLNAVSGRPEYALRSPALRERHFGIAAVTFISRHSHPRCPTGWPQGSQFLAEFPQSVVYLEMHLAAWARAQCLAEQRSDARVAHEAPLALAYEPTYLVAMPTAAQHRLRQFLADEWAPYLAKWTEGNGLRSDAPPMPKPW